MRDGVDEQDVIGQLPVGEVLGEMPTDLLGTDFGARLQNHNGHGALVPFGMRLRRQNSVTSPSEPHLGESRPHAAAPDLAGGGPPGPRPARCHRRPEPRPVSGRARVDGHAGQRHRRVLDPPCHATMPSEIGRSEPVSFAHTAGDPIRADLAAGRLSGRIAACLRARQPTRRGVSCSGVRTPRKARRPSRKSARPNGRAVSRPVGNRSATVRSRRYRRSW